MPFSRSLDFSDDQLAPAGIVPLGFDGKESLLLVNLRCNRNLYCLSLILLIVSIPIAAARETLGKYNV